MEFNKSSFSSVNQLATSALEKVGVFNAAPKEEAVSGDVNTTSKMDGVCRSEDTLSITGSPARRQRFSGDGDSHERAVPAVEKPGSPTPEQAG